ncbi:MAG: 50S ribosomal protein L10 [Candidatus Bathyarchaeia archaeon]
MSQTLLRREPPEWKKEAVTRLKEYFRRYPVVAAAELSKARSVMLHEIRRRLRNQVEITVIKKALAGKAAEELEGEKPNLKRFIDSIRGGALLLFTGMDPFKLSLLIQRNKVRVEARGGDIAESDIVVPAGNTGIPPGPVISEFGAVKIPTKIDSGTIWITMDTIAAGRGEVISPRLASLLSRLGIKPVEAGLSLISAYSNGTIITGEDLKLDLEDYKRQIIGAASKALNLAVNANIPTRESLPIMIARAYQGARRLAVEAEYPDKEIIKESIITAYLRALKLSAKAKA